MAALRLHSGSGTPESTILLPSLVEIKELCFDTALKDRSQSLDQAITVAGRARETSTARPLGGAVRPTSAKTGCENKYSSGWAAGSR